MYKPLKKFLASEGYSVKAEINGCDIVCEKDGRILVVEMKKNFNFKLLMQGVQRQKIADKVYLAITTPKKSLFSKEWNEKKHLLKRLELGLITVSNRGIKIVVEAKEFDLIKSKNMNRKKRKAVIKEFGDRTGDFNSGGSNKKKIMTSYREKTLRIASLIGNNQMKLMDIKSAVGEHKTASILQKNHYNWFRRVERGIYALTENGFEALIEYKDIIEDIESKNP